MLPPTSIPRRSANRICVRLRIFAATRARFVDKLPINYLYVGLIAKALPNARIVHVVRDPIDSCFASYKQLFADAYFHSYDLLEMARHHIRYRRLMDHWRACCRDASSTSRTKTSWMISSARRAASIGYLGLRVGGRVPAVSRKHVPP